MIVDRPTFTRTDDPENPVRGLVTVGLAEAGDGTVMTMTQSGMDFTDRQLAQTVASYNGCFDTMEAVLAQPP